MSDRLPQDPAAWTPPEVKPGQLEYTPEQLMASHPYEETLRAGDLLCHGGFVGGRYHSPRTLVRVPAIEAWKARLASEGHPLVYVPRDYVPPQYPSYEQAKMLLQEGVRDPVARVLTGTSIIEGFGARIRGVTNLELHKHIVEDIGGTALAHLEGGLFEAHARDEAGWRLEGGHKQMWEIARDLGLNKPDVPSDVLMSLLMNLDGGKKRGERKRIVPEIAPSMEGLIAGMGNVFVLEIFACRMFDWGKRLLGDPEISSQPREAGGMVANIEADEHSHIEYLRTALSEIRARTLRTEDGGQLRGAEAVDRILAVLMQGIASERPRQQREQYQEEIHRMLDEQPLATELRRRFENLDSGWTFPEGPVAVELRTHGAA